LGQSLLALDFLLGPTYELVLAGDPGSPALELITADVRRRYFPNKVLAAATPQAPAMLEPLLAGKTAAGAEPTLYICEGFACQAPARGELEIAAKLATISGAIQP
jgi:uncharacterized protein YyaL (SSP411 family)